MGGGDACSPQPPTPNSHPLRQVPQRAAQAAVGADFEVEVGAGAVAGAADAAEELAPLDGVALADVEAAEVGVEGAGAVVVIDDGVDAVAAVAGGGDDGTIGH